MKKINNKEFIWAEKYRPQCVADLIITNEIRDQINNWIEKDQQIPNLAFFSNQPGTGKTSISKSILYDLEADSIFINASKDNGIDTIRSKIADFASGISLTGRPKVVVLDEFDGTSNAFQEAFRGFVEEFSKNCRFIITGNYQNKVIGAVLDRFMKYNFDDMYAHNQKEMIKQIYERCCFILDNEQVSYDKNELKPMILTMYPAVREITMNLQESSKLINQVKTLRLDISVSDSNSIYAKLIKALRETDTNSFQNLVKEVHNPDGFFKYLYKNIDKIFKEESIGQVIIITHHYMNSNVLSRDAEITLMAYLHQLARTNDLKFKLD